MNSKKSPLYLLIILSHIHIIIREDSLMTPELDPVRDQVELIQLLYQLTSRFSLSPHPRGDGHIRILPELIISNKT